MCIYLTNEQNLTYNSQEHIFPAGIGGKIKLPKGYVSDQANAYFSKLETAFMRGSLIALPRRFEKIGHRGTGKITTAVISLMDFSPESHEFGLGYIAQQNFSEIPNMSIYGKNVQFRIPDDKYNFENDFEGMKELLLSMDSKSRYCFIDGKGGKKSRGLQDDHFLIGVHNKQIFIAANNKESIQLENLIPKIRSAFNNVNTSNHELVLSHSAHFNFSLVENIDTARCYAKIGFNVLTYVMGKDYVSDSSFDNFKQWLMGQSNNNIAYKLILEMPEAFKLEFFPQKCHRCYIGHLDDKMIICVSLFGQFTTYCFELAIASPSTKLEHPIIFVCDWKNEKEDHFYKFMPLGEKPWEK